MTSGGGNGTFDGPTAGSHSGFDVLRGAGASGQFLCNTVGNTAFDALRDMGARGNHIERHGQRRDRDRDLQRHRDTARERQDVRDGVRGEDPTTADRCAMAPPDRLNSRFGPGFTFPLEHVLTGEISIH